MCVYTYTCVCCQSLKTRFSFFLLSLLLTRHHRSPGKWTILYFMWFKTTLKNKKTKNGKSSYIVFGLDQRKKGLPYSLFQGRVSPRRGFLLHLKKKKKRERETEARSSKHIILWKGSHKDIYSTVLQILSLLYIIVMCGMKCSICIDSHCLYYCLYDSLLALLMCLQGYILK